MAKIILNTDGACRGNPGQSAIGVTLKDESGILLATISRRIGRTTNNQAEYTALIAGLETACKLGAREVLVRADSELLVKQINGRYRLKNAGLKPLYLEALKLREGFAAFTIVYIPRAENHEADTLANQALDRPQ
jgi:ribonuclease HI